MSYRFAVCAVKNSWWFTEKLSETRSVSFQNKFEKLVNLVSFIIRNREGCAVKRSCLIVFQAFALREWRRREVWHQQFSICFPYSFLSCFVLFSGFFCSCIHVFCLFSSSLFHPMTSFLCDFVLYSVSFFYIVHSLFFRPVFEATWTIAVFRVLLFLFVCLIFKTQ